MWLVAAIIGSTAPERIKAVIWGKSVLCPLKRRHEYYLPYWVMVKAHGGEVEKVSRPVPAQNRP